MNKEKKKEKKEKKREKQKQKHYLPVLSEGQKQKPRAASRK